jgi:hypothetical protein
MLRSTAGKVMWGGRATVFLVGLFMAALALWLALGFALANPAQATHSVCETDPETGKPICVPGFHSAPDLTVNSTSVAFFEGQTATNSGTYDDTFDDDLDETVTFTATEGTVTKSGTESGTWSWSRSNVQNPGSRTVTITATDSTGRSSSVSFTLTVSNVAPSVLLTSPTDGAFLKGAVTLSANAFDPGGVNRVEFLVSGGVVGTDTTAPYSINWNSATVADGSRTVSARAVDHQGAISAHTKSVTVDNTVPTVSITSGPSGTVGTSSATFSFSASDATSGLSSVDCKLDGGAFEPCSTSKSYDGLSDGEHTFQVRATDKAGNVATQSRTWTVDTVAPMVTSTTPTNKATAVLRDQTLAATFSEKMNPDTISKSTFKLFKINPDGSTKRIRNTTVTLSTDGLSAKLDPFGTSSTVLAANTRYKAVVTTGAKDLVGNQLDQNSTRTGNQPKVWRFKTGGS